MKNASFKLAVAALILLGCGVCIGATAQAQAMKKAPDVLVTVPSSYGFDDTVDLLKGAIEEENLMVIYEVNAQQMLRMVGMQTKGMKQILFFHPRYMKRIIETNRNGAIVPPLKIAVMEMPNGKVMVRYAKPTYLFAPFDGLGEVAQELEELVAKIVDNVKS